MDNQEKKSIVEKYFKSYNEFDVDEMVSYLHDDVEFRNISQGHVTLALNGKKDFTNQARQAVSLFEKRELKIDEIEFEEDVADIKINFMGILAVDVPDGPSKGDKVEMKGNTVLKFQDGKISSIQDIN